jgi:hypothetical protein
MCVFCAAIPFTMAIGASARNSQREKAKLAEARGEKPTKKIFPVGTATTIVISSLAIVSVVYHTHFIAPL